MSAAYARPVADTEDKGYLPWNLNECILLPVDISEKAARQIVDSVECDQDLVPSV